MDRRSIKHLWLGLYSPEEALPSMSTEVQCVLAVHYMSMYQGAYIAIVTIIGLVLWWEMYMSK